MILRAQERAAGVGEARRRRRQLGAQRLEAQALALVHGVVGMIGAGEMAHHQRGLEGGQQLGRGRHLVELAFGHAEAVHAGVDVDGGRHAPPARAAVGRPVARLRQAREHGAQIEARVVRLGAGQQAVEHVDGGAGLHLAGRAPLAQAGDEEGLAALAGERLGDRCQPQTVGVGLDDAGAFGPAGGLIEPRPVGAQGGEIATVSTARADDGTVALARACMDTTAASLAVTRAAPACTGRGPDPRSG